MACDDAMAIDESQAKCGDWLKLLSKSGASDNPLQRMNHVKGDIFKY